MNDIIVMLIAIGGSSIGIIAVMISLFLWLRTEANSDRRAMEATQREDRKDLLQIARSMEFEMKDFHHRLIEIEKSRKTS